MFQNYLIYHPAREKMQVLEHFATTHKILSWKNARNETIGWIIPTTNTKSEWHIILFHGNAGMALNRLYYQEGLESVGAMQIHVFEYPGYGARTGKPSQETIANAAVKAFDLLRKQDDKPIFLMGESIGCAVAAQLAAQRPAQVAGLFFITPFNNLIDVGMTHYPFFPLKLFVRDRYESDRALRHYHGPIAFLLAGRDTTIPPWLSEKLYKDYTGPKKLWRIPEADHNTIDFSSSQSWWKEVFEFLVKN